MYNYRASLTNTRAFHDDTQCSVLAFSRLLKRGTAHLPDDFFSTPFHPFQEISTHLEALHRDRFEGAGVR